MGLLKDIFGPAKKPDFEETWKEEECPKGGKHKPKFYASGDGTYICTKCDTDMGHIYVKNEKIKV